MSFFVRTHIISKFMKIQKQIEIWIIVECPNIPVNIQEAANLNLTECRYKTDKDRPSAAICFISTSSLHRSTHISLF